MKSYGQACGLAKALDAVGDRWSMLILRELMIRGACRYTDLKNGLPGIATNLLAERLRELEAVGVIRREEAPPPVATTLVSLTDRGRGLEPALLVLGQWGAARLADADPDDRFLPHWMVLPLRLHLRDRRPDAPPTCVVLKTEGEAISVRAGGGRVEVSLGAAANPDATVTGDARAVLALLTGRLGGLPDAPRPRITGAVAAVERVLSAS